MTSALKIFVCLILYMDVQQPLDYPVIRYSSADLDKWGMNSSIGERSHVITFRDNLDLHNLEYWDRKSVAHEFTRYILLVTRPDYKQGVWDDKLVRSYEAACYNPD